MAIRGQVPDEIVNERMRIWRLHNDARLAREVPSVLRQVWELFRPYSPFVGAAMLAVCFYLYRNGAFGWGTLPPYNLNPAPGMSAANPCDGKERCVIAYLAPWCGACQGSPPFFEAIRKDLETNQNVGMTVVVGKGDANQQEGIIRQFRGNVFVDREGTFARDSNVGMFGVPAVMVIDSKRNILQRQSGTLGGSVAPEVIHAMYIKKTLGLEDYYPHLTAADEFLAQKRIGCHQE